MTTAGVWVAMVTLDGVLPDPLDFGIKAQN